MNKVLKRAIKNLSRKSGYEYNFLVDVYNEILEDNGDVNWNYFADVTMEHDW